MALNSLSCAYVPLSNYSLTRHSNAFANDLVIGNFSVLCYLE